MPTFMASLFSRADFWRPRRKGELDMGRARDIDSAGEEAM